MMTAATSPASLFADSAAWKVALWAATTFRCHPTGAAPPIMGLVFSDSKQGAEIFSKWTDNWGNKDPEDAIRVAVVEGDIPNMAPGYSIHISAEGRQVTKGQIQRMHPSPETEAMMGEFKAQYLQHGEFLLCPTIEKNGQLHFDVHSGIVKRSVIFRNAEDITESDPDAVVLKPTPTQEALQALMSDIKSPE